jgi:hypothetical protein
MVGMRPYTKRLLIGAALAIVALALLNSSVTRMTAEEETVTAMGETSYRIGMYLNQHGHLPADFSALPVRDGYANKTTDAWGKPLIYVQSDNYFTLTSLGRDGFEGGEGDDRDIKCVYSVNNGTVIENYERRTGPKIKAPPKNSQN